MNRSFDPETIRAQIAHLVADRARIDKAIEGLESALRSIEGLESPQAELAFAPTVLETTLNDAVRRVCMAMADGITRQRVIGALEKQYPGLHPKPASVSAALINMTKGDSPTLKTAVEGRGRRPSFYSTEGDIVLELSGDEIADLLDENAIRGTGGWQSLWLALIKKFDKSKGIITMTPELRARLYQYFHSYGQGGWQNKSKRVFRRSLPHLFGA